MSLELIFFTGDEAQLALLIKDFQKCGFPLTQARVRTLAYQYAHTNGLKGFSQHIEMASKKWVKRFLSRHPRITVKKSAGEVSKEYKTNLVAALVRDGKVRMTRSCEISK